jgi:hypothetical protein
MHLQDRIGYARWRGMAVIAALLLALVALLSSTAGRHAAVHGVRWFDDHVCGQWLREIWGRLRWREDWSAAADVQNMDYGWLPDRQSVRIAHALGAAGLPLQNSLQAFHASALVGFRLMEVDLWLDPQGHLRCHHAGGPQDGVAATAVNECDATDLFSAVSRTPGVWLVLDLKSGFAETGRAALDAAHRVGVDGRLIFQLYQPEDSIVFAEWRRTFPLPGPIITTYRAHRPIWSVLPAVEALGYRAVALPLDSVPMIPRSHSGVRLLAHPVHDCNLLQGLQSTGISGFYMLNDLPC